MRIYKREWMWLAIAQHGESDQCLLWPWSLDGHGYGQVWNGRRVQNVNRFIHEFKTNTVLSVKTDLCHTCDTPACFNPKHLFIGSRKKNLEDMVSKGRSSRGEKSGQSKLTNADVLSIKYLLNAGLTHSSIAESYSVGREIISKIHRGERWSHLKG